MYLLKLKISMRRRTIMSVSGAVQSLYQEKKLGLYLRFSSSTRGWNGRHGSLKNFCLRAWGFESLRVHWELNNRDAESMVESIGADRHRPENQLLQISLQSSHYAPWWYFKGLTVERLDCKLSKTRTMGAPG